ncbi:hypothetical protein NFI96_025152 [Prochilodus magdalenae]|nr:hypothetical protein NFI96_025152 [Prochilodus magdalenae]
MKLQGSAAPRGSAGQARCGLRQVQVKVSELGLGYPSQEELVFRYCSGLCLNSVSNYDKILTRLAANHRSPLQGAPPTACCRPTAYERRLAFLDDNLLYHILRKHSARRTSLLNEVLEPDWNLSPAENHTQDVPLRGATAAPHRDRTSAAGLHRTCFCTAGLGEP